MGMFRYTVVIEWDPEERVFVATVPALPVSTYGKSRDEAIQQVRDAIAVTIEGLQAAGELVPPGDGDRVETVEVIV